MYECPYPGCTFDPYHTGRHSSQPVVQDRVTCEIAVTTRPLHDPDYPNGLVEPCLRRIGHTGEHTADPVIAAADDENDVDFVPPDAVPEGADAPIAPVMGINPQQGTYSLDVLCSNCAFVGNVELQRGYPLSSKACPNCGCATLGANRIAL